MYRLIVFPPVSKLSIKQRPMKHYSVTKSILYHVVLLTIISNQDISSVEDLVVSASAMQRHGNDLCITK